MPVFPNHIRKSAIRYCKPVSVEVVIRRTLRERERKVEDERFFIFNTKVVRCSFRLVLYMLEDNFDVSCDHLDTETKILLFIELIFICHVRIRS